MSSPFIFVSTNRLMQGQREAYQKYLDDFVPFIEQHEPELQVFRMYLDEDGEHVSGVQVHRSPRSMLNHMEIAQQHIGDAYADYLEETVSIQLFGEPNHEVLALMQRLAGEGVPISINRPFNGFDRLP
jgi:hypothetical protein